MDKMRLPESFQTRMQTFLGEEWDAFLESYENHKFQALRLNGLKKGLDDEKKEKIKKAFHIDTPVPWAENGYYYPDDAAPGKHPWHEMGMYYIQEPSAMSAAALLHPAPGERVLDLCSAPGGKTTQLAAYLQGEGLLISNEIHPARCKILAQNVERMGIANCIVTNEDSETLAKHFPSFFHKIQVDAPCSGEGMFRKIPEAMEEWSPEHVLMCADRQLMILREAAKMLMAGGTIVYSTCTFAKEENEDVIAAFLAEHEEFELARVSAPWFSEGCGEQKNAFRLWPHKLNGEGHFAAVLRKKGAPEASAPETMGTRKAGKGKKAGTGKGSLDKQQMKALEDFLEETVDKATKERILGGKHILFGDQLYVLPKEAPSLDRLKVQRPGLHIGTFKKDRLEPSHALALFLGEEEAKQSVCISIESAEAISYLRGESLFLNDGMTVKGKKGWCLVCIDGCSAGWGKLGAGQVKNHYPKGLRKPW